MLTHIEKELFRGQDAIEAYVEGLGSEEGLFKDLKGIAKRILLVWREYVGKVILPQGRDPVAFGEIDDGVMRTYMFADDPFKKVDMESEDEVRSFEKKRVEDDLYGLARFLTQARIAEMKEQPLKREASIVKAIGLLIFMIYELRIVVDKLEEITR